MAKRKSGKSQTELTQDLTTHQDDPILHLSTVAAALGRSPQTIGRWVTEECLPSIPQPNGLRKIRKSELIKWLDVTGFGRTEGAAERVSALTE